MTVLYNLLFKAVSQLTRHGWDPREGKEQILDLHSKTTINMVREALNC